MNADSSDLLKRLPETAALHRVLRTRDAAEFCALSVSHFRRLHARGEIPPAIRLSERRLGWRLADLIAWLRTRQLDTHTL